MTAAGSPVASRVHAACDEAVLAVVRSGLERAGAALGAMGVPIPRPEGKVLRPVVAYALVPPGLRARLDFRFWSGALAVQMVHEASLLHDDILDGAGERRGAPTLAAELGVGPALVLGDHYLTGAYRAAASAGAPEFLGCFIAAVERTVAGEVAQGRAAGRPLSWQEYRAVVEGKSGELFGAAALLGAALLDLPGREERVALGRDLGALYQQVDDLLDYCPAAMTGKPPLQDYRQRKWTWVLGPAGAPAFGRTDDEVLAAIFLRTEGGGASPARRGLAHLRGERDRLVRKAAELSPGDEILAAMLDSWVDAAEEGVAAQEAALAAAAPSRGARALSPSAEAQVVALACAVGGPEAWPAYFGRHAKTFRFASRLFPPEPAALVAGVYAYCRFTDDLVDAPADDAPEAVLVQRLEAWSALTRSAFEGERTGVPLLDGVLGEAGARGVSWRYPDALLSGVGMDLSRTDYRDWAALEEYTFGVAGAVGGWVTQLFGLHDTDLLERAHALGHAMQLTNIARDVGEDLGRGRLYLPGELLLRHGFSRDDLESLAAGTDPVPPAYREMTEAVLARADALYAHAWPGIRALPGWYRRPVAVAAEAYRGIHERIRRNRHDNLRLRAHTPISAKLRLAVAGLARARSHG